MSEKEPRKASEVLLDLESKVDSLTKTVNLYNLNLQLVLGTVNKTFGIVNNLANMLGLNTSQTQVLQQQLQPLQVAAIDLTKINIPEGAPIDVATEFPGRRRTERADILPGAPPLTPPASEIKSTRKIPVVQRIQDINKKDIFMADVQIFSANKELVTKAKTSAMGKYQAQLLPGKYTVKISKVDPTTKKKVEAMQEINVVNSDTTVILPNFLIQR